MSTQPCFWLKVTPEYVVENFEELLKYVSLYNYEGAEPNDSDYNQTVDCLSSVARKLIEEASALSFEDKLAWKIDTTLGIRMIITSVLAEYKRHNECHDLILGLLHLLLLNCNVPYRNLKMYVGVVCGLALKAPLRRMPLHFSDADKVQFSETMLCARMTDFLFDFRDNACAVHEGFGSVLYSKRGVSVAPMNYDDRRASESEIRPFIELDCNVSVVDRNVRKKVGSVKNLEEVLPRMLAGMDDVRPSVPPALKKYVAGELLDVRVVDVRGVKVVCESIDPEYEKISGNMYIDGCVDSVGRDTLLQVLEVGDVLSAVYNGEEYALTPFNIDHSEDDEFKKWYFSYLAGNPLRAIRQGEYSAGTQWLTEYGPLVNIMHSGESVIDVDAHRHQGACVKVRIENYRYDRNGNLVVNGAFMPESEQNLDDVDEMMFRRDAMRKFAEGYVDWFQGEAAPDESSDSDIVVPALPFATVVLGHLVLKMSGGGFPGGTVDRMSCQFAASLLLKVAGRSVDVEIARREFNYYRAIAAFSMGASPISLEFNPAREIEELPHTLVEKRIVDVLRSYKESNYKLPASSLLPGEKFSVVEELVNASNILIDKIDTSEISRIKKHIVTNLGVADLFCDINRDKTFYGMESDTLEFKVSCVRPPENMCTGSELRDINVQRYIILKTICAFLNSQAGGELLVGVNDSGYAVGIDSDLELLVRNKMISEPNADHMRTYIKRQIDRAFVSDDGNVSGNAITAGNISINIEESSDRKTVLRFRVNPYPYDVVRIAPAYRLDGYNNVFIRSSGSSMPLNTDGVRNTRMSKLKALNVNEVKLARILQAIDEHRVLLLREYHSYSGITDRRVEPHCMDLGNTAFQAYDPLRKDMRLFKLSRIGSIEILPDKWKNTGKHFTRRVDIFGMMESAEYSGGEKSFKMNDFALMLLREEYPSMQSSSLVEVKSNTGADARQYPWIVSMTVFHTAGYTRFMRGLPDDVIEIDNQ